MSLLEDVLHLLQHVLEYFGVPQEMLVPVWESTLCGQYRSIVRMIGSNLPLSPSPRIHFQIPLQTISRHGHIEVSVENHFVPSLADVLDEVEGDGSTKFRSSVSLKQREWQQGFKSSAAVSVQSASTALCVQKTQTSSATPPNLQPETLQKINALETELLKLRAQIAHIITAGPSGPATPCSTQLPTPVLTSTPLIAPPPPPPPPPLPPPPTSSSNSVQVSVKEVIRQRKAGKSDRTVSDGSTSGSCSTSVASLPSMLDVLKDMNQVKLRCVERSPGGTPVRKRKSRGPCRTDPASLIAEALKKKFAHRQLERSHDKENNSAESSPFSSPDTTKQPTHMTRRSQGRNHL